MHYDCAMTALCVMRVLCECYASVMRVLCECYASSAVQYGMGRLRPPYYPENYSPNLATLQDQEEGWCLIILYNKTWRSIPLANGRLGARLVSARVFPIPKWRIHDELSFLSRKTRPTRLGWEWEGPSRLPLANGILRQVLLYGTYSSLTQSPLVACSARANMSRTVAG
jgi:hypothetical protein